MPVPPALDGHGECDRQRGEAGHSGRLATRDRKDRENSGRWCGRRSGAEGLAFALRLVLMVVMTVVALVSAEYFARFQFRRARTSMNARDYIARSGRCSQPRLGACCR